jgi:Na+/H+ antiporter NhaD/arsenite permease-like protein
MILDNVTTVIVFAPLTVLICRLLKLNPMPFLIAEAMLSNVGGAATLVGDPPNIMIGSAGGIDFSTFLVHMGPPVVGVWLGTVGLLLYLFRRELTASGMLTLDLDHGKAIQDPARLRLTLFALGVIVILFFVHHHLHLYPAFAAFAGLALALVLLRPEPNVLIGGVNWSVLIFFSGLFIIVGGVESSGLLDLFGEELGALAKEPEMLLITCLALMWLSAVLSAIVDNIPFTVTMIPIILGLESQGVNIAPLWWALALGVGLGGNATHIGATANLIVVAESEQCGIPNARISPTTWMRHGIPTTLVSLTLATLLFTAFFDYFR